MLSVILPYKARTFLIHGLSALCTRLLGLLGFLLYTIHPVPVKRSASAPILSPAVWVVCPGAPALASQLRQGPGCGPESAPQTWPGGEPTLPFLSCRMAHNQPSFACLARQRRNGSSVTLAAFAAAKALVLVDIGGRSVTIEGVCFSQKITGRRACRKG